MIALNGPRLQIAVKVCECTHIYLKQYINLIINIKSKLFFYIINVDIYAYFFHREDSYVTHSLYNVYSL